jgi:hypothetical protein
VPAAFVSDAQAPGAIVQVQGDRMLFVAFDQSGVARIDAAIGRKRAKRCRFVSASGKLGAPRSCKKPVFARVKTVSAWQSRVADLPKGSYQVRFKLRDVLGNATARPRAIAVKLG